MSDPQTIEQQPEIAVADVSTDPTLDVVNEVLTYVVVRDKNTTNPKDYSFSEYKEGNNLAKAIEKGEVEELRRIQVTIPFAHTYAGIAQLVPDEEEAVAIFTRGAMGKLGNKLRSRFLEVTEAGDFVNTEETFDASEDLTTPTNRRGQSEAQKALKFFKSRPDLLAVVLKSYGIVA